MEPTNARAAGTLRQYSCRKTLRIFARGRSYAEIAKRLDNSNPVTVRNAVYGIQQELRVWAARSGLLDDELL